MSYLEFTVLIYLIISYIRQKIIKLGSGIFTNLERLIRIAEYLADNHSDTLNIEREKSETEWEANKKAVSL